MVRLLGKRFEMVFRKVCQFSRRTTALSGNIGRRWPLAMAMQNQVHRTRLLGSRGRAHPRVALFPRRSRIFLLGAAGEQEENGLGASASGPARNPDPKCPPRQ